VGAATEEVEEGCGEEDKSDSDADDDADDCTDGERVGAFEGGCGGAGGCCCGGGEGARRGVG